MSDRRDTKTVISSTYTMTFVLTRPAKRTPRPIPKTTEQGLKSEDIEKRRQGATLSDRPLERERLRTLPVHLHYRLRVVVQHADPFMEHRFESGGLQKRLGLQIDQRSFSEVRTAGKAITEVRLKGPAHLTIRP